MHLKQAWLLALVPLLAGAADLPRSQNKFIVIAHRGNHTRAHENTLRALQAAIDVGADYAEIDVRRTSDGQYILLHDQTVDRMTDGHGALKDLTLEQVRKLNVRDLQRPQIAVDRIPTFGEALELIKGRLNIYLDFKAGDREAVARLIHQAGVARQILIYDDLEAVGEWHQVAPELPLIVSSPDEAKTPEQTVRFAQTNRIEVLDGGWEAYSPEMVAAARRSGVQIWPDIQEAREDGAYFERVLKVGFTGVQSDHPEELIAWLKEKHLR